MSIDKVEVTNLQGDLLTLSLEDTSGGYVVEEIEGLGPVKATIATSNFATMNGQQYQASSRESRNIVLKLGYAPDVTIDQTILDLRSRLYEFFMTDTEVELTFHLKNEVIVDAKGRVETCEPAIFTREPQMDISIICFDPDFVDPTLVSLPGFTTIDDEGHEVYVDGSVDTGLTLLSFTAPKSLSEFTIYHTTPSGQIHTMIVSVPLVLNDIVELCTIPGRKSITLTRGGVTSSLLWAVSPESTWVLLERGLNLLYLNASVTGPSAPVTIQYNNRYGGL